MYLSEQFLDRWVGRGGPQSWPLRSPGFNPVHLRLWWYIEKKRSVLARSEVKKGTI